MKYDPAEVSYGELLHLFMSVAHDPTEFNRQGHVGTAVPSAIFFTNPEQEKVARAYVKQLDAIKVSQHIVTNSRRSPRSIRRAYHQNYLAQPRRSLTSCTTTCAEDALKKQFPPRYAVK